MARSNVARGPSQRQLRAGELVRHAVAEILTREEAHAEILSGLAVTITEVRVSPDLRNATVFCTPLGGADADGAVARLNKAAPVIRGVLGRKLEMKFTPALSFRRDDSFDAAGRIDAILASDAVRRDLDD